MSKSDKFNTTRDDSQNSNAKGAFFPDHLRQKLSEDLHLTETAEANARQVIEEVFGKLPGDDDPEATGPVLK